MRLAEITHPARAARAALVALAFTVAMAVPSLSSAGHWAAALKPFVAGAQISERLVPGGDVGCLPKSPGTDSTAIGTIEGSGLATMGIGKFTLTSVDCVRASNPYFLPPYAFSSRSFKLRTQDGDEIVASYNGTATLDPVTLLLELDGSFEFTGGTGKYRNVRGSGRLIGVEDMSGVASGQPARGFVTMTGYIKH